MPRVRFNMKTGLFLLIGISACLTILFLQFLSTDLLTLRQTQAILLERQTSYTECPKQSHYVAPEYDMEAEYVNIESASSQHVQYFMNASQTRGTHSKLGVIHRNCDSPIVKDHKVQAYTKEQSSLCSNELWTRRNGDLESFDLLDYARCTPYVISNVSTLDCIESKHMPRNCALSQHRFCRATNVMYNRLDRWMFYDPTATLPAVSFCLGTEIDGGNDEPFSFVSRTEYRCKQTITRSTFFYGRYVAHHPGHRYQIYHSIHGDVASLFATILDTDPNLLDLKTMKMKRDKIQIMLLNRAKNYDDPTTPEMVILNMISDSPIIYGDEMDQYDNICFENVVVGVSNRLYIERRDISMAYSGVKRKYLQLFNEFIRANLPPLKEEDYKKFPFLAPRPANEPIVIFSRRIAGDIVTGRSAFNEQQMIDYLTDPNRYKYAKYVHSVDFMTMTGLQQLHTLSQPSTIFTGMFGATFAHLFWMNPKGSTAIMWRNEVLQNRIYDVVADLGGIRFITLILHREQCAISGTAEIKFEYDRRKTIENAQPDDETAFRYTRDLTCYLDMEKLEVLISSSIEYSFHFHKCFSEGKGPDGPGF